MIPSEWKRCQIQEIATIIRGASPRPKGDPRYYGGSIPRLMVADVTRDGKYVTPKVDYLTEEGAKRSRPVPAGTLTIVCSGTVGIPSILAVNACIHDGFLALEKVSEECNKEFLYYIFSSLQQSFEASATHGGVFINLTTQILKEFEFSLPPIAQQKKIAEILGTWDEAIGAIEKLIAAKQKLKKSLMQKVLTGQIRLRGYLNEPWKLVNLGQLAEIRRGASPRPIGDPEYFSETGRGWVRIADVTASKTYLVKTTQYLSALGESKSVAVDPGDLIMSICATIGVPRIVKMKACIHDGFVVIRSDPGKLLSFFLYHFIKYISLKLADSGQPGTQKNINTSIVSKIKVPAISLEEQIDIADLLSIADEEIYKLEDLLVKLQQQKRGLMQKLLTGQWRVKTEE
jgi:type I restriction enzyme, S subunit